jgi:hypothetical protein
MHKLQLINFNFSFYFFNFLGSVFNSTKLTNFFCWKSTFSAQKNSKIAKFHHEKNQWSKGSFIFCVQILVVFQAQRVIASVSMVYRGAHGINQCPVGLRTRLITIQGLGRLSNLNFDGYHFTWNSHPLRTEGPYTYEKTALCVARPQP